MLAGAVTLFALSLACVVSAQTCNPNYGFVTVQPRAQETGEWCWAASQQMALESHGDQYFLPQCLLVTEILRGQGKISRNIRSCCDPEHMLNPVCSRPNWPDFPRQNFNPISPVKLPDGLDWEEIKSQICSGHPLVITLEFKETAHQFVIGGYKVLSNGKRRIWVIDPIGVEDSDAHAQPQARWRPFEHFYVEAWGGEAKHSRDYIEICPLRSMRDGKCG